MYSEFLSTWYDFQLMKLFICTINTPILEFSEMLLVIYKHESAFMNNEVAFITTLVLCPSINFGRVTSI